MPAGQIFGELSLLHKRWPQFDAFPACMARKGCKGKNWVHPLRHYDIMMRRMVLMLMVVVMVTLIGSRAFSLHALSCSFGRGPDGWRIWYAGRLLLYVRPEVSATKCRPLRKTRPPRMIHVVRRSELNHEGALTHAQWSPPDGLAFGQRPATNFGRHSHGVWCDDVEFQSPNAHPPAKPGDPVSREAAGPSFARVST